MKQSSVSAGFKTFLLIWFGQLVSLTGSGLTGFALGVWVYLSTGSVTKFALISLSTSLPGILFSPFAGALVDRWDRRVAMIVSDTGSGLCTFIIAVLFMVDRLEIWHIYILMGASSAFSAFQWPAYTAATTLLVPKNHYGRASGMVQIAEAVGMILSPLLAGSLVVLIGVQGVILIDFATFLFAVGTLLLVRVPRPPVSAEGKAGGGSLLQEAAYGWKYITARLGLLGLLLFFAATNFTFGIASVLFTPLVLSFTTPSVLGFLIRSPGGNANH
jgi:MFS family permease